MPAAEGSRTSNAEPTAKTTAEPYVRLLGRPGWALGGDGQLQRLPPERTGQLLAYLAWAGQWVTREQLADLFWPDHCAADSRRNVRRLLFRLRQQGMPPGFEQAGDVLRWKADTDVARLLLARKALCHDEVIALYGGPFLQGLDGNAGAGYGDWLNSQRSRLSNHWRQTILSCIAISTPIRRHELAQMLVAADPLDEPAILELAEAQRSLGKALDAHRVVARYEQHLKSSLGIAPSMALRQRVSTWQGTAIVDAATPPGQPPVALDTFVGRRRELRELRAMLATANCRWITVLGAGGMGKSRLLREATDNAIPELGYETVWVFIGELRDAQELSSVIAAALGIALPSLEQTAAAMTQAIGQRVLLLVLDNAEHLEGWTETIEALLAACPGLKVAVSSRRRTHARGEWLLPLDGLPIPDADSRDLEAASAFDAVTLFEHRARQAGRHALLDADLDAVLDILTMVDGMPLAIELAASWARVLSPSQIATELTRSMGLLSGDAGRPGLAAVFDRSWVLLLPIEQRALVGLTVFSGSFGLTEAVTVTGMPPSVFAALVDKSMAQAVEGSAFGADGMRLLLHPLVKHFARIRGEADPTALRELESAHAGCYAAWLANKDLPSASKRELEQVAAELANLDAALRCAVARQTPAVVRSLAWALGQYATYTGRVQHAVGLFDSLLAGSDSAQLAGLRAPLLPTLAALRLRQGHLPLAEQLARRGIRDAKRAGDSVNMFRSIAYLGFSLIQSGRPEPALHLLESAVAHARRRRSEAEIAKLLEGLGHAYHMLDRLDEAARVFEEIVATKAWDNITSHMRLLNNLALVQFARGDLQKTLEIQDQALEFVQRHEMPAMDWQCLSWNRGVTLFESGRVDECRQVMTALLASLSADPHQVIECGASLISGRVLVHDRNTTEARPMLLRAAKLAIDMHDATLMLDCALAYGDLLAAEGERGRAIEVFSFVAHSPTVARVERQRAARALTMLGHSGPHQEGAASTSSCDSVDAILAQLVQDLVSDQI